MLMRAGPLVFCAVFLFGCSAIFSLRQDCASGPEEALIVLFDAVQNTDAAVDDLGRPPAGLRESLDFKKIMRIAPDPRRLLVSLGDGDARKGWQEFRFLRSLSVFHNISGLEFQEYKMSVASIKPLSSSEPNIVNYEVLLRRVDVLLDMSYDGNFKEVEKEYSRTFIASFTRGGYCLTALKPIGGWLEVNNNADK